MSTAPTAGDPTLVHLTINGRKAAVPKGTLLVEAAKVAGFEIPVFCYHPKLKPVGACRMCLVEIEKMPRLQTACTTPVAEGMVATSVSPGAVAGQNAVIEMLLANHPLDCPICDKGGECPLQDNTFKFGLGTSRMREEKRSKDKAFPLSDRIVLDKERCIMCYRCTRFQAEIAGDQALVALDRGGDSEIGTQTGEPFESPFSGNTIELCPVGALTSRFYRFRARPWDLARTPSVCSGCSVGCNVSIHARDGAILRLLSRDNPKVDDGWLCDRGRFGTLPPATAPGQVDAAASASPRRPLQPLVRQHGVLAPAPLEQALLRVVALLRGRSAVLASPTLTNEAVAVLDRELRPAAPHAQFGFLPRAGTPWPVQGRIASLPACRKVLLLGLDPWTELPVLALWLRKAALNGGSVVAVGKHNGLFRDTAAWLQAESDGVEDCARGLLAALQQDRFASQILTGNLGEPVRAAAAKLQQDGPAAVLLHPALAEQPDVLQLARSLAQQLGADPATGMLGAPAFGANARGAQETAPQLASAVVDAQGLTGLLLLGVEQLPPPCGAKIALATAHALPARDDVDVVLPMLHPYETAGTYVNFAGERQRLQPGGFVGRSVPTDQQLLSRLRTALLHQHAGAR
jgi:NADH-quinone oxidoreductase subunit G